MLSSDAARRPGTASQGGRLGRPMCWT